MKIVLLFFLLLLFAANLFSQNAISLSGKITDKQTGAPLPGATVTVKGSNLTAVTDNEGYYRFPKLNAGTIVLLVSYVGYETEEVVSESTNNIALVANAALIPDSRIGNEVVISATKREEKITNAPASIHVIGIKDFNRFAGSNVNELVSKIQGVEYTRSGVDEITFNARGLNSAFNVKVMQLVDGRNSMAALSGGIAIFNNGSTNKEDIERIEVVLGPQSALYGPNAHNVLFNYITKDPRKYQGTTVAVSAGSQQQFSSRIRHAAKINNKWAYKLTGEHATGKDYTWYDTVYAGNQRGTPPFYGPPVAIPERLHDFTFRRYRGEAHVYYSITPKADIIVSAGGVNFTRLQVTTTGRNQLRDVTYSFVQARFVHPRFFANVYNTWGNLGKTLLITNYTRDFWNSTHDTRGRLSPDSAEIYATRLGNRVKERSERLNADLQYNYKFKKAGLFFVAGLSYQKDKPNGFGIGLVDSFQKITTTQYGAVVQLEKTLPWNLRVISTTRFDHHSTFGNFFAPRFALTKGIADGTIRVTWGKAYAMPSILNQYAGVNRFLFGNGKGIYYIPNETNMSDTASFKTTEALKAELVNTWEIGYKGTIWNKLFIDINYYNGISKNFISPTITVGGRVLKVGGIRVTHNPIFAGTVNPNNILKGAQFFTYFNYGDVRTYGLDIGINYTFNKVFNAGVKYSWFGSDITNDNSTNDANKDNYVSPEEKSLNAPKHRAALLLNVQNLCKGKLFVNVVVRWVQQYDFYSGNLIGTAAGKGRRGIVTRPGMDTLFKNFDWGPLGGFTSVDLSTGYQFNQMISINLGVTNLFNTRQIEFVGSPSVGRLIMAELKVQVPSGKKKE
ncbi:TonB-dependent receptor [Lacibacter sediminis]|uniref:TonB-dependent receptor n=1 Tax=Lacibacter sediminis TaxID=2760713 RepID=A0A7G5XIX5_9BACT|nr:TonB-dependent receptor [Lacibacter sediminis]QNA45428.1 TonB-dependent receptor [Lacibacter sediminis]